MNRRWICSDVWMDILPSFERVELGLTMALLSDRFDALVDAHFGGKSELTIWRDVKISKDKGPEPTLSVRLDGTFVDFPLPDHPLPNKIRFCFLLIDYIDHSVIEFLRSNKQIWDRTGTKLGLDVYSDETEDEQRIWDIFVRQIWPLFVTNIRHLRIKYADDLDNMRRYISPTLLTDLDQLISIDTYRLFPDAIGDDFDGPNASAGQALSKWLHTPTKNGQPKRLLCADYDEEVNLDWVNSFKEAFARATASVSYKILFEVYKTSIEPFESVNERTKEKLTLTLEKVPPSADFYWLLKRCPISEKAAAIKWENDEFWDDNNLNNVNFFLWGDINESIGPLSPPAEEEKEEEKADECNKNVI